jgi:hypothetical protein
LEARLIDFQFSFLKYQQSWTAPVINLSNTLKQLCAGAQGDWSDKSALWTPALRAELDMKEADDGAFWMKFDDFIKVFDGITVRHYVIYDDVKT